MAVLVAHSAECATLLRERRPGQRVELIPHGCPTWFPPRKARRGRVVATFGFLEPHKGLTALVDAGILEVVVARTFPLTEAAAAHELLAGQHAGGKVVLVP